jgi:hypothetical protein
LINLKIKIKEWQHATKPLFKKKRLCEEIYLIHTRAELKQD